MIKINLLPPKIFEARTIKRLIGMFVVIAVLIVGGGIFYMTRLQAQTQEMKAQADIVENLTNDANRWTTQAAAQRESIKPIRDKVTYIQDIFKHNNAYPDLYEELNRFTYGKVSYGKLAVASGTITLDAHAPNLGDAGRYLMNLYRATHLFSSISMSQLPGYSSAPQSGGTSVAIPASMPGVTPPRPAIYGAAPAGTPGSSLDMGRYAGLSAVAAGVTKTTAANPGFDFQVTCVLKSPPVAPVLGSSGGAAAPGGAAPAIPNGPSGYGLHPEGPPQPVAPSPTRSSSSSDDQLNSKLKGGEG